MGVSYLSTGHYDYPRSSHSHPKSHLSLEPHPQCCPPCFFIIHCFIICYSLCNALNIIAAIIQAYLRKTSSIVVTETPNDRIPSCVCFVSISPNRWGNLKTDTWSRNILKLKVRPNKMIERWHSHSSGMGLQQERRFLSNYRLKFVTSVPEMTKLLADVRNKLLLNVLKNSSLWHQCLRIFDCVSCRQLHVIIVHDGQMISGTLMNFSFIGIKGYTIP